MQLEERDSSKDDSSKDEGKRWELQQKDLATGFPERYKKKKGITAGIHLYLKIQDGHTCFD